MNSKGVSIVGCGYVGLCLGACLADTKNFRENYDKLYLVDINEKRINDLNKGVMPFYEPGLEELVKKNSDILSFTTDLANSVSNSGIIFIAVGTPVDENGNVDLSGVLSTADSISKSMNDYKIIVSKSTVPVGTTKNLKKMIKQNYGRNFDVISNPEFLKESTAIYDTMNPDRIVIGYESIVAANKIADLYKGFNYDSSTVLFTDINSAELIKYSSNAFLATKISFINEIARLCELTFANVEDVARGMGFDKRIGKDFLRAGIGYGGSCLPKDNRALIKTAADLCYNLKILKAVEDVNKDQRRFIVDKLELELGNLENQTIGLLGLSFKPNTDDMRGAPSLDIIKYLNEKKAFVKAYDPIVKSIEGINLVAGAYQLAMNADALVLVTEWPEFKNLDFKKLKEAMRNSIFIDGRNFLDKKLMEFYGFDYHSIGK